MKFQNEVSFVAWLLMFGSLAHGGINGLEGQWTAPTSSGITSVEIQNVDGILRLHAFGRCHPTDCDWGQVALQTYAPGVDQQYKDTVEALSAEFVSGFARTLLLLYPADGDRLRIETFTVFTDSSGRLPYHKVQILLRLAAAQAETIADLAPPLKRSPPNGSVFSSYPRITTLQWSAVAGAAKYGIDVDCYHCCQAGHWCTEVGSNWLSVTADSPAYTFDFVGAQPGRWRVWAISPSGQAGPKTDWWEFRYSR